MNHKSRKGRIALLFLLSMAITSKIQAQVSGNGVPDAKMAPGTSLTNTGLESIYTPNLFEGTLNIGIPIYSYSSEDGNFGISLSYNTKGVKVDEVSPPVGVHWNMDAEPSITRIAKDIPDEYYKECSPTVHVAGFGVFDTTNLNRFIKGKYITYTETPQQQAQTDVYRDKECDEFVLSLGGRTVRFTLGANMQIFTHPHQNLDIKLLIGGTTLFGVPGQPLPASIIASEDDPKIGFSVRDEKGNVFLFEAGDSESARYFSTDQRSQQLSTDASDPNAVLGDVYYTTRWVLKKATFASGKQINYFYTPRRSANYYKQYMQSSVKEDWSNSIIPPDLLKYEYGIGPSYHSDSFVQISRIEYPNGIAADFSYDPQEVTESNARLLQSIKISGSATECLRYTFNQGRVNGRNFLNTITLKSCDGLSEEPYYSFGYNPLPLPPRLNSGQDLYGYYNADSIATPYGTDTLYYQAMRRMMIPKHIPGPIDPAYNYGSNRSYNAVMAQAGILTKVANAYGGELSFRYKAVVAPGGLASVMTLPNSWSYFIGATQPDGVAIDSIIETEKFHPGNSRITVFNQQGGQLFMPGGMFHFPEYIDNATNAWKKVFFQNMFLSAHDLVNGSNHGYSTVEMTTMTGSGTQLSRKLITFSNMVDNGSSRYYIVPGSKNYFEYPYTDKQYLKSWELGLPLETREYDQDNALVLRTVNRYDFPNPDLSAAAYISSTRTTRINSGTGVPIPFNGTHPNPYYPNKKVITDTYYPFTGKALLAYAAVQKFVSNSKIINDTTWYEYDSKQNLSVITTRNSEGVIDKTIQVYNYSITNPQSQLTLVNMNNSNIEKIVSIERWREGTGAYPDNIFSRKLLSSSINTFQYQNGLLRPRALYTLTVSSPVTYSAYTGIQPGGSIVNPYAKIINAYQGQAITDFENTSEVVAYDDAGNPLETQMADQAFSKAMIWDKATGNKLAEAVNCHSNEIAYNGFETGAYGNFTVLNTNNIVNVNTIPGGGINGRYAYLLTTNPLQSRILTANLTPNKVYYVTFWANGGIPNFSGAGFSSMSFEALATKGSWTYYKGKFIPLNTGQVGFTSSTVNMYLDELRIYPVSAKMQSWTYLPLFGISAETDANGRIVYYEYDAMGRPAVVRDQDNNILSKKETVINGND